MTTNNNDLIPSGHINVVLSSNDFISILEILSFSKGLFEQMSVQLGKESKEKAKLMYALNAQLAHQLHAKFAAAYQVGEPSSKEIN